MPKSSESDDVTPAQKPEEKVDWITKQWLQFPNSVRSLLKGTLGAVMVGLIGSTVGEYYSAQNRYNGIVDAYTSLLKDFALSNKLNIIESNIEDMKKQNSEIENIINEIDGFLKKFHSSNVQNSKIEEFENIKVKGKKIIVSHNRKYLEGEILIPSTQQELTNLEHEQSTEQSGGGIFNR